MVLTFSCTSILLQAMPEDTATAVAEKEEDLEFAAADSPAPEADEDPSLAGMEEEVRSLTKLQKALEKEREANKKTRNEYRRAEKKIADLEQKIKKTTESFDPEKYQQVQKRLSEYEEAELFRKKEFQKLLEKKDAELVGVNKQLAEFKKKYEDLVVQSALENAFLKAGGREDLAGEPDADLLVRPSQIVVTQLRQMVKIDPDTGEVVAVDSLGNPLKNEDGRRKTPTDLMIELRKSTLAPLFHPQNPNSGMGVNPQQGNLASQVPVVTRDQIARGEVSMDDILTGKVQVMEE